MRGNTGYLAHSLQPIFYIAGVQLVIERAIIVKERTRGKTRYIIWKAMNAILGVR